MIHPPSDKRPNLGELREQLIAKMRPLVRARFANAACDS